MFMLSLSSRTLYVTSTVWYGEICDLLWNSSRDLVNWGIEFFQDCTKNSNIRAHQSHSLPWAGNSNACNIKAVVITSLAMDQRWVVYWLWMAAILVFTAYFIRRLGALVTGHTLDLNPWLFVHKTRPKPKILKPQPQNPNRKLIIQNSKNEFVRDESSDSLIRNTRSLMINKAEALRRQLHNEHSPFSCKNQLMNVVSVCVLKTFK